MILFSNALCFRAKSRIADRIRKKERRKAERDSRDSEDNGDTKKRRVNKEISKNGNSCEVCT